MTMTTTDIRTIGPNLLLDDYLPDGDMAKLRGVKERALRAERLRGDGPPWVKDGRRIFYSVSGYREWLKARLKQPVRSGRAA
jgi:hypothetical protein